MGEILPKVPKNNPPLGRTEFDSFRDLFTYLAEESGAKKAKSESELEFKSPEDTNHQPSQD